MPAEEPRTMRVECTDCGYVRTVGIEDGKLPAERLREHGRETGHELRVYPLDGEREG